MIYLTQVTYYDKRKSALDPWMKMEAMSSGTNVSENRVPVADFPV
jgi:hypothetical protein